MAIIKAIFTSVLLLFVSTLALAETILQDLKGEKIAFSSLQGKWVFLNYWASWCEPCLEEIPELNRFYSQHKNDNVALFAVNFDAPPLEEQKQLVKQFNIRYPALKFDPAEQLNLGAIEGVPVTFVFNPEGKLVGRLFGGQSIVDLNAVLKG